MKVCEAHGKNWTAELIYIHRNEENVSSGCRTSVEGTGSCMKVRVDVGSLSRALGSVGDCKQLGGSAGVLGWLANLDPMTATLNKLKMSEHP